MDKMINLKNFQVERDYYKGKYYALFAPNDSKGGDTYIYTTTKPEKGWTLHSRLPHFHDSSFLFDDDDYRDW